MTWSEFLFSPIGLFTVGFACFMIGIIVGINIPFAKRRDDEPYHNDKS